MRLLILLLLSSTLYGQALSVTCTKATQGSTATCTGSGGTGPYTYSVSAGSGSIGAADGVYTPPALVEVKQKIGPCQLLPPDHVYNTKVDSLPVHADSTTIITRGGSNFQLRFESSAATNILNNATPTFDAVFAYTPLNNGPFQFLDWPEGRIQSGWFINYFAGDRHILAVNRETCEFSDLYNKYPVGANTINPCPLCTSQSGVKYNSDFIQPANGATDAAGMLLLPVTPRLSDFQAGAIKHALRFTMSNGYIQSGASTNFQWPATTGNSTPSCSAPCWKYGMYARLKSSVNISGFSAAAQMVLTAMKEYGIIMTDGGTSWAFSSDTDWFMNAELREATYEIFVSALRNTDFEVVDTSSLAIAASSAAVNRSTVTPSQYAEVTVTDSLMATATTRVNLAGIVVGTPEPAMTIMAGHTVTPTWWVTGTATQTVTWTMDPDVGTLNSSTGEFTPDSTTTPLRTRLTATSTVEATAQAHIDVIVWPDNAAGNIYVNVGRGDNSTVVLDTNTYWPDEWFQVESFGYTWALGPAGVHANTRYFYPDVRAKWYIPNGNYKLRLYHRTDGSGALPADQYQTHLETQGSLIYRNYSIGRSTGGVKGTGGHVDVPMKVVDGSAVFALRTLSTTNSYPAISAIAIEADATSPYITIDDPAVGTDITISATRQFYAVGWYMANTVTWAVQSGPGSIDSNGLYTAPSTPPSTDTTVTVRATSTVDGMVYAETSFDFVFGTVVVSGPASVSRGQTAQFSAAIGGVPYTNVTWSRSGSQGSIDASGLYSAPASITDGTITITATPIDAGGSADTADLDLVQLIDPIRTNAGNTINTVVEGGRTWIADPGPSVCAWTGTSNDYTDSASSIANLPFAGQLEMYKSRRYRTSAGTFGYACTVPNGTYQVTLKWANGNAVDQKARFSVAIEGVVVLSDFNLTTEAGGVQTAIDRTYTVTVADGVLTIEITGISNAPSQTIWAQLNGIEINDLGPVAATNSRLTGTLSGGARIQ